MLQLILTLTLSSTNPQSPITAQIQSCVWPNVCKKPAVVAQVQSCVWPNVCRKNG